MWRGVRTGRSQRRVLSVAAVAVAVVGLAGLTFVAALADAVGWKGWWVTATIVLVAVLGLVSKLWQDVVSSSARCSSDLASAPAPASRVLNTPRCREQTSTVALRS
jgi:hypothetical protein